MKKEPTNTWILKMKILPNREPGFASGLCSMVCLWFVLIPAIVMAIMGFEIHLTKLILPALGALLLATLIFAIWRKAAIKIEKEKR